jgi:hypothetical protein
MGRWMDGLVCEWMGWWMDWWVMDGWMGEWMGG